MTLRAERALFIDGMTTVRLLRVHGKWPKQPTMCTWRGES